MSWASFITGEAIVIIRCSVSFFCCSDVKLYERSDMVTHSSYEVRFGWDVSQQEWAAIVVYQDRIERITQTVLLESKWNSYRVRNFWLRWSLNAVEMGSGELYDAETRLAITYLDSMLRIRHLAVYNTPVQFPVGESSNIICFRTISRVSLSACCRNPNVRNLVQTVGDQYTCKSLFFPIKLRFM